MRSRAKSDDCLMVESKLMLPPSPPSSPLMTRFDQHPPRWPYVLYGNQTIIPQQSPGEAGGFDEIYGPDSLSIVHRPQSLTFTPNGAAHQGEIEGGDRKFTEENQEAELSDVEQEAESGTVALTKAEMRAYNRRLQRFRLTHSQTRYLMSEFAKQPRPNAAQRERLSREISGFSPRQVQVWFQNRRAKLKRLTSDDRESIMSSRALPADFDMTHALRSPFIPSRRSTSHGIPASAASLHTNEPRPLKPSVTDTSKRFPMDNDAMQPQAGTYMPASLQSYAVTPPYLAYPATTSDPHRHAITPLGHEVKTRPSEILGDGSYDIQYFHGPTTREFQDSNMYRLHLAESRGEPSWSPDRSRISCAERINNWLQASFQEQDDGYSTSQIALLRYPQGQEDNINVTDQLENTGPGGTGRSQYSFEAQHQWTPPGINTSQTRNSTQIQEDRMHPIGISTGEARRGAVDLARVSGDGVSTSHRDRHDSLVPFVPPIPPLADGLDWR